MNVIGKKSERTTGNQSNISMGFLDSNPWESLPNNEDNEDQELYISNVIADNPTGSLSSSLSIGSPMSNFLSEKFLSLLPRDLIEAVFWSHEDDTLRIWIIIERPNWELEDKIIECQLLFIEQHPNLDYDFSIIYSFGRTKEEIKPDDALALSFQ